MSQKPTFSPKLKAGFVCVGVAFLAVPLISTNLDPNAYEGGRSRDELSRRERNSSAVGTILGEFRSTFSDMVFIKTERYLHGGIAYQSQAELKSLSVDEELEDYKEGHEHNEDNGHDHTEEELLSHNDEGADTVIPTAETDFRGIIGAMEREIKPWQDPSEPHKHGDGKELLPWYRVMTISDPENTRAYIIGAWWLTRQDKPEEALRFLNEGIAANPKQFQPYYYKGRLIVELMRRDDKTLSNPELLPDFPEAIDLLITASKLAIEQRPAVFDMQKNATESAEWNHYMEDDAGASMRMAVILMRRDYQLERALKFAEEVAPKTAFISEDGVHYSQDTKLTEYIKELRDELGY